MQIADVLARKGRRIVTVHPSMLVANLPRLFDEQAISSLVVMNSDGRVLGIVTDRLFIRALARHEAEMYRLTVGEIMHSPAPTCGPNVTVTEALRIMTDDRIRHLVVMSGGEAIGIVSIGDLVAARHADAQLERRVLREMALGHLAAETA